MASIEDQLKNVRTMEDVVNLLTILFTNLNNQNEMYYNMFLNPEPMDLQLERYDENGELVTVTLANRAKDLISAYSGPGNPNGVQAAREGALYIDTISRSLYYKAYGTDSYGWSLVWTQANLIEGENFLTPNGNASNLTNLNMNNAALGTLAVSRGGTGTGSITGLVKGNGTSAFTAASAGTDYVAPDDLVGAIMFYPVSSLPTRSLVCDGTIYSISVRPELTKLFNKLGDKYGGDGVTTFGVPNLIGRYFKGGTVADVGNYESGQVGVHAHAFSGYTDAESGHTHTRGSQNITGSFRVTGNGYTGGYAFNGAFYNGGSTVRGEYQDDNRKDIPLIGFDASRSWTGVSSGGSPHAHSFSGTTSTAGMGTNEVDHMVLVPIIKY